VSDRPYVRRPSPAPPTSDSESTSAGVHCFRWTKRGREPEHLRDAKATLKALLAGDAAAKGGAL
jgi:hypothetical protein